MCQRMGRPPISTMGLGRMEVSSEMRVPRPPASMTAFILGRSLCCDRAFEQVHHTQKGELAPPVAGACILRRRCLNTPSSFASRSLNLPGSTMRLPFPHVSSLPGVSGVQVSGKVIDADDLCAVVESGLGRVVHDGAVGEGVRDASWRASVGVRSASTGELGVSRRTWWRCRRCARRSWGSGSCGRG